MNGNSSVVRTNSVQSQFATLTRDRDNFRNILKTAEQDCRVAENQVHQLKERQKEISTKLRAAQEALGAFSSRRGMLLQQHERLTRILVCERKALEDCVQHLHTLECNEIKQKRAYCKEMDKLNTEMAAILDQEYCHTVQQYLSVESIEGLIDGFHDESQKEMIYANIAQAFDTLKMAEENFRQVSDACHQTEVALETFREHAKQQQFDPSELAAKEELWVQNGTQQPLIDANTVTYEYDSQPHMKLFYGPGSGCDEVGAVESSEQDQLSLICDNNDTMQP